MKYVVVYDISDTKRRNKVSKLLSSYGMRVQFSCFEIEASLSGVKRIEKEISEIIDHDTDRVFIFPISRYVIDMVQKFGVVKELNESTVL
ncbi:CRISPR-associated endonuclease Cas2 [Desulfurobacterium sp.]|uniref:CRISPR-associated endonuclease Cas2 n=1 Tax=Desulfurobacterium sp. TaxID=2004706 RepID=UPI0026281C14|nr:CRISPR-associated endonuclease Cas2 [Desulfurobacterium sp.]